MGNAKMSLKNLIKSLITILVFIKHEDEMQRTERRSQQQRSSEMTEKLRTATIQLITEVGYVNTNTVNISSRAGVSRGALLHHYANKSDLVIDATSKMWKYSILATQLLCKKLTNCEMDIDAFVDGLWRESFNETYVSVTIDIMIAARGDKKLAQHLDTSLAEMFTAYRAAAAVLFKNAGLNAAQQEVAMTVIVSLLRGLRVQEMMRPDAELAEAVRKALKLLLQTALVANNTLVPERGSSKNPNL